MNNGTFLSVALQRLKSRWLSLGAGEMEVWVKEARVWGHLSGLFSPSSCAFQRTLLGTRRPPLQDEVNSVGVPTVSTVRSGSASAVTASCSSSWLMLVAKLVCGYSVATADASRQAILRENWGLGRWPRG